MVLLRAATWFGLLFLSARQAFPQVPFAVSCAEDAHIDTAKKKTIDAVAMNFIQTVLGPNPSAAFDFMSKAGQAETTGQQLDGAVAAIIRQFEPKNVTLQNTYLIELKGKSPGRVVCATDLSKPDGWESLAAENIPEQAHVLLSADTINNKLAFVVWLVPEQGEWKVQSFRLNISTLADKDSLQLWELARAQEARQHSFNAALLYAAAAQTADRGPNFQLGITQSISDDMSKFTSPPEITGQPPFFWKDGETTYKVMSVGPIAVGGKIYVIIVHEVSPWQSDAQVDGWNKDLLNYLKRRFPQYSDVFAGLVARAIERGSNRGYGTVEGVPNQK
ncbi:MAG TPA: hypothetical protein VNZ03_19930 [Terriglobales bacterium]|jgi:hypothetical protein|nr:hypothetical protein [Terriglobales bacterium]